MLKRPIVATGAAIAAITLLAGAACSSVQPAPGPATPSGVAETTASAGATTPDQTTPATSVPTSVRAKGEMTTTELVRVAEPAIVRIATAGGVGSGFIVSTSGDIITNHHVVARTNGGVYPTVTVTLSDGADVEGKVIGSDPRSDLALVRIAQRPGIKALDLAKLEDVAIGQDVVAIGYALDLKGGEGPAFSVTRGIVSQKNRGASDSSGILGSIQTDAAINHGNSGGPLLNLFGQVVGVNQSIAPDRTTGGVAAGIGFAVGSDIIRAVYDQLKDDGRVDRGLLGIRSFESLRPAQARQLGLPETTAGVVLSAENAIAPGGPAARAGIASGDVITKIGGVSIKTEADLAVQMIRNNPGSTVDIELFRGGKKLTLQVTLGDANVQ